MATINISEKDYDEKVIKSPLAVLVDFWAPWCGPCKMAEPVLEELSDVYNSKVTIAKINVDENPNITSRYGVMSIPTTVLFKGGVEVGRQIGFAGKNVFEELIKRGL